MARPKKGVNIELAQQAKAELKRIKDYKVCIRLQAIISSADRSVELVSDILGIHGSTLWRWIKRFKKEGVKGLYDRPKGHNPAKLGSEHREKIAQWLTEGKNSSGRYVHWTLKHLQNEIESVFGVKVGKTPLWLVIRKLGFRQKVPRPVNAKADLHEQQAFKKNG